MERFARRDREEGQAAPLVLAVVALVVVVLLGLVPLARAGQERAAARTAADAAALAGAAEGEGAAREVAEANGAELVSWKADGLDVWVEVVLGEARAVAKARRSGCVGCIQHSQDLPYTRVDVPRPAWRARAQRDWQYCHVPAGGRAGDTGTRAATAHPATGPPPPCRRS